MTSRVTFADGLFGPRLVLNGSWDDSLIEIARREGVVELELNQGKGWQGDNLRFLQSLQGLLSFEIFDFNIHDISPIHVLSRLRRLGVTTYCSTEINFCAFPQLQSCGLEWRPKATSLFNCFSLGELFINRYKGKDSAPFGRLKSLKKLSILNAPLKAIAGLSSLTNLRSLRLAQLTQLESLSGIEALKNLEELTVHSCRKISSIKEIISLENLRRLHIINDGDIQSLQPIVHLKHLESLVFSESTNILDGDLSPIAASATINTVAFQNRRHYSHRREDFRAYHTSDANV